jgi:hypothetical protein
MRPRGLEQYRHTIHRRFGNTAGKNILKAAIEIASSDSESLQSVFHALLQSFPAGQDKKIAACVERFGLSAYLSVFSKSKDKNYSQLTAVLYYYIYYSLLDIRTGIPPDSGQRTIYYPDKIDTYTLDLALNDQLHFENGNARFYPDLILLCAYQLRKEKNEEGLLKKFVALIQIKIKENSGELPHYLLYIKILFYFCIKRDVSISRVLWIMEKFSGIKTLSSKDLPPMLYDFYIDDRYTSKHLSILLSLLYTCIATFYPGRSSLIPVIMALQKDFIRLSGSGSSKYLKQIFELFVQNPHLDLTLWIEEGARIIRKYGDSSKSAAVYFEKKSDLSKRIWMEIDTGIHFEQVEKRLQLFIHAITEKTILLRKNLDAPFPQNEATYFTDGKSIYIPPYINYVSNRDDNYTVLLHSVAHECAHIEFDSFSENKNRYLRVSAYFEKLFPGIFTKSQRALKQYIVEIKSKFASLGFPIKEIDSKRGRTSYITLLLFHADFPFLLRDIWNVVEDTRVNTHLYTKYQGFSNERQRVVEIDFNETIDISSLDETENLIAGFIQKAAFGKIKGQMKPIVLPYFERLWDHFAAFTESENSDTYDSMSVAGKIYKLIFRFMENHQDELLSRLLNERYTVPIDFYHLGIEVHERNTHLDSEAVRFGEVLGGSVSTGDRMKAIIGDRTRGSVQEVIEKYNYQEEMLIEVSNSTEVFTYPEWDHEKTCYIEDRCRLAEAPVPRWSTPEIMNTHKQYRGYLENLKRVFMRMKPQKFKDRYAMDDGSEIDFDRYTDCLMDLLAGRQMEENFYIFRERNERDILSALVLDMSPSTSDNVRGSTIFRYEKTAAYLLAHAMDSLGDPFGIFSYFDFGSDASLFFTIKPFDQGFSQTHERLLLDFQPAVKGYSRLSVGLRHLTARMRDYSHKSKIIFFITDGYPFYFEGTIDRGEKSKVYHIDGTKKVVLDNPVPVLSVIQKNSSYMMHDLRKVYEEAVIAGIHMFCITLDENSVDFMGEIFGNSLIFLPEISELPQRLIEIFKRTTS